jgi:hypothetical protein
MTRRLRLFALAFLALGVAGTAAAHEVRPGYLEISQVKTETFEVFWKVPARGELRLALHPRFPENCKAASETIAFQNGDSFAERLTLFCQGGLVGRRIEIDGLPATMTDVLVRLVRPDGSVQVLRLMPSAPSFVVEATPSRLQVAATYLRLGVEHILGLIDHLLFVLALLILIKGRRQLITTVTAFTLAHSLTLAAATLGLVDVPQRPVEAVIALSIMFVAMEIVRGRQGQPGLTESRPWVVAFVFGLLHGFGFAGALSEVGLPPQAVPLALLFFNVGVEIGQLLFITSALLLVALGQRVVVPRLSLAGRLAPYGIGSVAAYWTIARVAGFWG